MQGTRRFRWAIGWIACCIGSVWMVSTTATVTAMPQRHRAGTHVSRIAHGTTASRGVWFARTRTHTRSRVHVRPVRRSHTTARTSVIPRSRHRSSHTVGGFRTTHRWYRGRRPIPPLDPHRLPYYYWRYAVTYVPWTYWFVYRYHVLLAPFYPAYFLYGFCATPWWDWYWWDWYRFRYGWYRYRWDDRDVRRERYRATAYGEIWLNISPDDAVVYVDGAFWGRAGDINGWWKSRRIPAGTHTVRVEHPEYGVVERTVKVAPGRDTEVAIDLEDLARRGAIRPDAPSVQPETDLHDNAHTATSPDERAVSRTAILRVRTDIPDPMFFIDGHAVAAAYDPATDAWVLEIPWGTHTLEIRSEGHVPRVRPVRVTEPELTVEITRAGDIHGR